ncbi:MULTISPECIES: M48 family metallopeptidase [unclassified Sulfitobacter]|uniref:M48 family metallopeptidase n=2 Tax=Sulfitobacter TaxID=60136 RepID=UPI0007C2C136|nr:MULTISPECIES: SprT family zinc-dependent metalloprotease [unclassified Sulfitobacter]KZX94351.1 zinc metalloprotease [Sulfitobacter sp. HI0023]KZY27285.1 zinc metalloprotease [Sulfitobacter sp. HI0040]
MKDPVLPGDPPVPLVLRRSARARRITLRISQVDGRVTLTLPAGLPASEAMNFAREKEPWIRGHLAARGGDILVGHGARIPVEGRILPVVPGGGRSVGWTADGIAVPGPAETVGRKLLVQLKGLARDRLAAACDEYADRLGRPFDRITLRDTRSRWGSCTSDGGLMFSWRLIMSPPEVLRYVAAHEIAHLEEMNHSPAFWQVVQRIHGDHRPYRNWLREHGADLHRYRF